MASRRSSSERRPGRTRRRSRPFPDSSRRSGSGTRRRTRTEVCTSGPIRRPTSATSRARSSTRSRPTSTWRTSSPAISVSSTICPRSPCRSCAWTRELRGFDAQRATTKERAMGLQIGDTAPDFEADTSRGKISFHDWIGDSWAVLFSHPKDFTPVCTTELGYMASIKPEFDRRGVKIIGLSVDPLENHEKWSVDIAETQGTAPNYPIIADTDFNVSKLYAMLGADVDGDPTARTAAQNSTLRN